MASPLVLVSSAKGERRTLKAGLKQLSKHLKLARCDVQRLNAATGIRPESLAEAAIVVFGCPTRPFTLEELECVKSYLQRGGAVLVLASAGGESASSSNLNYLLEEFGIAVADDAVIQSAYTKYTHPREVLVDEGVLSPDMAAYCAGASSASVPSASAAPTTDQNGRPVVEFAYPHGATLVVQEPAVAILSSGRVAHPFNMALGAVWWGSSQAVTTSSSSSSSSSSGAATVPSSGSTRSSMTSAAAGVGGRLAVLGSCHMFDDEWLGREANRSVLDFILGWMLRDPACSLSRRNLAEPEIVDLRPVAHVGELGAPPRAMLELPLPLPADPTTLFSSSLFKLDLSLVPEVGRLYEQLGVPRKRLQLWRPELEVPFPPLQPAVFPPMLHEPPAPPLELFDLDEEFAGPLEQLSRITARYLAAPLAGGQLEAYIQECGALLRLRSSRAGGKPKALLAEVLQAVVQCKMADAYG